MDVTFRVTKEVKKKKPRKIVRTIIYISDSSDDDDPNIPDKVIEITKKIKIK